MHDLRVARIDVGGEVIDEVVFRDPGEALFVDVEVSARATFISSARAW
jgi:hypothetical protein